MIPITSKLGTPPTGVPVPPTDAPTPLATTMALKSGWPGSACMLFPSATAMDVKRIATGMLGMMAERIPVAIPNRIINLVGLCATQDEVTTLYVYRSITLLSFMAPSNSMEPSNSIQVGLLRKAKPLSKGKTPISP